MHSVQGLGEGVGAQPGTVIELGNGLQVPYVTAQCQIMSKDSTPVEAHHQACPQG